MSHLLKSRPLPVESLSWLSYLDESLPSTQLGICVYSISQICASAPELLIGDISQLPAQQRLKEVLGEAISMDSKLQSWNYNLSEPYRYMELSIAETPFQQQPNLLPMQPKNVHVYHDIWMASLWNHYRFVRIRLLQTLTDCESRLNLTERPEAQMYGSNTNRTTWEDTLVKMVDDICASVPFLMGDIDAQGNLKRGSGGIALGGYFLLWPLHIASSVKIISMEQREWIRGRLRHLGTVMGINQAHLLAAMF